MVLQEKKTYYFLVVYTCTYSLLQLSKSSVVRIQIKLRTNTTIRRKKSRVSLDPEIASFPYHFFFCPFSVCACVSYAIYKYIDGFQRSHGRDVIPIPFQSSFRLEHSFQQSNHGIASNSLVVYFLVYHVLFYAHEGWSRDPLWIPQYPYYRK